MISNNISYNSVYDKSYSEKNEMLCFYRLESGQKYDIQYNTFAHNENGYYLVNYINYYSSQIMSSAFINNTARSDLIFLTQPNSYENTVFKINHCTFYKNYETDTTSLVDILGGNSLNLKVTIISCQFDSLLPSTNLYSNYFYINNEESATFNVTGGNVWNLNNVQIIQPPSPSGSFVCQINPIEITPSESPTLSPSKSNAIPSEVTTTASHSFTPTLSYFSISPSSSEIFTSSIVPKNHSSKKAGLICGVVFSVLAVIIILVLILLLLKKKNLLCFGNASFYSKSIDILQSNEPVAESNQDDIMSGKVNIFEKINPKNTFDYSLVV